MKKIDYRKIYVMHHGSIPRDCDGRTFEIHHIDGNHQNNDISNLEAVSIQRHYDIHYQQGDFGACFMIAKRMNMNIEEIRHLAKMNANSSRNPFKGKNNPNQRRLEEGTHNFFINNPSKEGNKKMQELLQNDEYRKLFSEKCSKNSKEAIRKKREKGEYVNPATYHRWISNSETQKSLYVNLQYLETYLEKGWFLGRKYKNTK